MSTEAKIASQSSLLSPGGRAAVRAATSVQTVVVNGVAFREEDVALALANHMSLKGALAQLLEKLEAYSNDERKYDELFTAAKAATIALRKASRK